MEINETEIYKYLEGKNNRFYCERIDTVASDVKFVLSRNPVMFSNYTNHDIILNYGAYHHGYNFGNITVFCYDGYVYMWFK